MTLARLCCSDVYTRGCHVAPRTGALYSCCSNVVYAYVSVLRRYTGIHVSVASAQRLYARVQHMYTYVCIGGTPCVHTVVVCPPVHPRAWAPVRSDILLVHHCLLLYSMTRCVCLWRYNVCTKYLMEQIDAGCRKPTVLLIAPAHQSLLCASH